jgi:hypothetical protein
LQNAIEAMEFEKNQIKNFIKQKNRIRVQSELAGNKYKKNGGFANASAMMLGALGIHFHGIFFSLIPLCQEMISLRWCVQPQKA